MLTSATRFIARDPSFTPATHSVVNLPARVQDGKREAVLAELCGLMCGNSRIGVDAQDITGNPFELKTTSKGGVSTARDLGMAHLEKWRRRYWVIANFKNYADGFVFGRIFFLAPQHLEQWFSKIEAKLAGDERLSDRALAHLDRYIPVNERQRLDYLLRRGRLLNDPNIPKGYVEQHGIDISTDPAGMLAQLVRKYPLMMLS